MVVHSLLFLDEGEPSRIILCTLHEDFMNALDKGRMNVNVLSLIY